MPVALHAFADERVPAAGLAAQLGLPLKIVETHRFPDGEILPRVPAGAATVIVYRSLDRPNEKLVELLLAADAWRHAGARRLVLVAPYMCYMRQDTRFAAGEPLSQQVVGRLLGPVFDRIVTVDAHLHRTSTLQAVFADATAQNLCGADAIGPWYAAGGGLRDVLVVGPDVESRPWVQAVAAHVGGEPHTLTKHRQSDQCVTLVADPAMDCRGRQVLLVDDICSSGGTLVQAVGLLRAAGAARIDVVVTHALCAADTVGRLRDSGAMSVRSTDSVVHETNAIPLGPVLAAALRDELPRQASR